MDCVLGIDVGSSSAKVGLFALRGETLAVASGPYPTSTPLPHHKEQDPAEWWTAVQQGIRSVITRSPAASILAIGIGGHISSLTFLNAAGQVLCPAIGFQDRRAINELEELYSEFSRDELARLLGIDLPPGPTWPLPRLLWMRKHQPSLLADARYLLQAKDYINWHLTGSFASDHSSNRGMVDFSNNEAAESVFARLKLRNLLPPLFAPQEVIGQVTQRAAADTGLRAGLPVVAGWNDLNACVLGSGIVGEDQAFNVTGTSEHIGVVTRARRTSPKLICAPYLHGRNLVYGVTSSGGGSLQWLTRFFSKPMEELLLSAKEVASEVLFLPYLEGERSPIWDPHASAVFLGLRSVHGAGHAARAVLEGVAFSLRQNLDAVQRLIPRQLDTVIVSGGGSEVELWNQIKADVLATRIATLDSPHAGILGAAILAAAGLKLFPDVESAAASMSHLKSFYHPSEARRARADRLYTIYCEIYPLLRKVFPLLDEGTQLFPEEAHTMTTPSAVVFGAGKIARGFIAHLLTLSGYHIIFVEKNPEVVGLLRSRKKYFVQIMGAPDHDITINGFDVLQSSEEQAIADVVANASVVFVSIGGPNLPQVAPLLANGIRKRQSQGKSELNIILGENYFQPAEWLRSLISDELDDSGKAWFKRNVGIVETMILRSTIEPTEEMRAADPLSLKAQNMWDMPADKEAFVGGIPAIRGLSPKENFQSGLIRKLFTYNSINAVIAYTGYLRGYTLLSEAANDPQIAELARASYLETIEALCCKYGFDREDQREFAEAALAKYQKREIVDPIERNTRDPLRKLSRHDRLVGPACLAAERGAPPLALSKAIAAALLYDQPTDASSIKMLQMIQDIGIEAALSDICGIDRTCELTKMILSAYHELKGQRSLPKVEAH